MPSTGVARTWMTAVEYMPQTNSGISNQPMPGARSLCTVAMKLRPVKIEEKPRTKTASVIRLTVPSVRGASRECRKSSRCRRRR